MTGAATDAGAPARPVPYPDRDSAPWWAALARHELVLQRCDDCGAWRWPARVLCGRCGSLRWQWTPLSGRGTLASWIVNHHAFLPGFESPYAVVLVRLDEQDDLLLPGSFVGALEGLRTGMAVRAVFDDVRGADEPITLLAWERAPDGAAPNEGEDARGR